MEMIENRKKYTKEFKLDAVRMLEAGEKAGHEIEHDLVIGSGQVYRWRKQLAAEGHGGFPGKGKPRAEEGKQGVARGAGHSAESNGHFLKTPEMKYAFMSAHQGDQCVEKMAEVLEIARSGYYAWKGHFESLREGEEKEIVGQMREIQEQVHNRYGSPRVREALKTGVEGRWGTTGWGV